MNRSKPVYDRTWIYLVAAIRRIWRFHPDRRFVKENAKACALCKKKFIDRKEIQVDHRIAVGKAPRGLDGWDAYLKRMFCKRDTLQPVHKSCHKIKTAEEKRKK